MLHYYNYPGVFERALLGAIKQKHSDNDTVRGKTSDILRAEPSHVALSKGGKVCLRFKSYVQKHSFTFTLMKSLKNVSRQLGAKSSEMFMWLLLITQVKLAILSSCQAPEFILGWK